MAEKDILDELAYLRGKVDAIVSMLEAGKKPRAGKVLAVDQSGIALLKAFLSKNYVWTKNLSDKIASAEIFDAFLVDNPGHSHIWFSRTMEAIGIPKIRRAGGMAYRGIRRKD